jgi:hypothetical protein
VKKRVLPVIWIDGLRKKDKPNLRNHHDVIILIWLYLSPIGGKVDPNYTGSDVKRSKKVSVYDKFD